MDGVWCRHGCLLDIKEVSSSCLHHSAPQHALRKTSEGSAHEKNHFTPRPHTFLLRRPEWQVYLLEGRAGGEGDGEDIGVSH